MQYSGAQIIVEMLKRQGIKIVAGIPGGANLPLYDALFESGIQHVLARHEQGAGFIAQGMARSTGKVAVCIGTSGPGATNLLTAIADAKLDSIPIVAITGQVATSMIGTDAFQEVDTYGLSVPITKHNYLVRSASELLSVIPEAFRIAGSGRPGPVLIDVPKDVQKEIIEVTTWPRAGQIETPKPCDPELIAEAARLINEAEKPILYLGGGTVHADASEHAVRLVEKAGLPTTMTLMGLGVLPVDHELSLGMLGMHAARFTNMLLEECDLLIAAGARFDDRATGKVAAFCPQAKIIHIDIDPSEIDKIKTTTVGITGDVGEALKALVAQAQQKDRSAWLKHVQELKRSHALDIPRAEDPLSPYGIILSTAAELDDEVVIVTDVGQHQMWAAQTYPFRRTRQWLTSGGLGTMGFGLPAALGAALACPDRQVVCFSGDGSLLMNIQELATTVEENANVKIVLLNNNTLGLVRQQQTLFFNKRIHAADFRQATDFMQVAKGFGMPCVDLGQSDNPKQTLKEALHAPGPCLIHVPIAAQEQVYPMVPPGAANKDMIGGETR